jgi:arsenate reductase-like glutaredoxin family protein
MRPPPEPEPPKPVEVQIFGVKNNADVRKAERFFKERRIKIHFMDFKQRSPSKGELRRFFQKFGEEQLIDRQSKRFLSLGLQTAYYGDDRWLEIACDEPLILRQPLVRAGNNLSVGLAEGDWKAWVE